MVENEKEVQNELQHDCECGCTADKYLTDVLETLPVNDTVKNAIAALLDDYHSEKKSRTYFEKELKELGQGTTFLDVEKLRTDINTLELEIFNTREEIRKKTESMQEAKAIDQSELNEKRDELRTIKKQCEEQLKLFKKTQLDALKQKRHEMTINEDLRQEADMTKADWKEEVKARTKKIEDIIPQKVEELRQEQEKNIGRFEQEINELSEVIEQKYGAIEEEIRKLKDTVKLKEITLNDLKMARINRLAYIHVNEICEWKSEEKIGIEEK